MEPVFNLKRPSEVAFGLCIICQESTRTNKDILYNATPQGIETIRSATESRKKLRQCDYARDAVDRLVSIFNDPSEEIPNLVWHKKCYGIYTDKNKIRRKIDREQLPSTSSSSHHEPGPPLLRSRSKPMDWKKCIFCQDSITNMNTCNISTFNMSSNILSKAKYVHDVFVRIADVHDLIAAEGCYHPNCLKKFFRVASKAEVDNKSVDLPMIWLCQELRNSAARGHIIELSEVFNRYIELANEISVEIPSSYHSRPTTFKEALSLYVVEVYDFIVLRHCCPAERQTILVPKNFNDVPLSVVRENEEIPELTIPIFRREDDEFLSMVHVALYLRSAIMSHPVFKGVNINEEAAIASVPQCLYMFLNILLGCQGSELDDNDYEYCSDHIESLKKSRVVSIGQDIVYSVGGSKKATPKHIGLGLTLHEATRSRKLVDLFHSAGHIISYKDILRIDTALAELTLESMDTESGSVVPPNLVAGRFVHFSADNIDINDSTLDGKNTFHATQIAAWQRGPSTENFLEHIKPSDKSTLDIPEAMEKIHEVNFAKGMTKPNFGVVDIEWFQKTVQPTMISSSALDMTFIYSRQDAVAKPSWTSFNQANCENDPPKTTIGYMPIIQAPAHDLSTLNSVVMRALYVARSLSNNYVVITVDQALFPQLMELKWNVEEYKDVLIPRLGGLHITMNFLKVIGQHMEDSGLLELWIESGLLGPNTAEKVKEGKSFAKGVRAHKLTWQALWHLLLPQVDEYITENDPEMIQSIREAVRDEDFAAQVAILSSAEFHQLISSYIDTKEEDSNFLYWWQYMNMVSILLMFIRAQRDGIWDLHLAAFREMLPYFHRYDHTNYSRWGSVYLASMKQLPEEVENEFRQGNFVVKGSEKTFNQVDPDHSLEWLNGIGKKGGGIIGITKTTSALSRWALSYNLRGCIAAQTREMFHVSDEQMTPNEATPARIKRDNNDESNIIDVLKRFKVFDTEAQTQELTNIATKDVATIEIRNSLLQAESLGQIELDTFVQKRLVDLSVDLKGTLPKTKAPTFSALYQVQIEPSKGKIQTLKADRNFYQRLITAYHGGRQVDLHEVLTHELMNVPISIAETNGSLRSGQKSILMDVMTKSVHCPPEITITGTTCLVIDGQASVMALGKPNSVKTFGDFADSFIDHILRAGEKYDRIDVTFDRYNDLSIKSGTRDKRKKKTRPIRRIIDNKDVPLPNKWTDFLALPENKRDLSVFLSEALISAAPRGKTLVVAGGFQDATEVKTTDPDLDTEVLQSNHEEADTRLILHCVNSPANLLVVSARDTDVFVLLVSHFDKMKCRELWMKAGTSKQPKYIPIHEVREKLSLDEQVFQTLPAFHAVTGCDTVSYLSGHSKKTAWDVFLKNHLLLKDLGTSETVSDEVLRNAEYFICNIYKVSTSTCDEARVSLFCKCKSPETMPPTSDAVKFHISRANYQTLIWRQAHVPKPELPPPTSSGWDLINGVLQPILKSLPAVPNVCKDIVTCGCTKGCVKNCSCKKGKQVCTLACKCANADVSCKNK